MGIFVHDQRLSTTSNFYEGFLVIIFYLEFTICNLFFIIYNSILKFLIFLNYSFAKEHKYYLLLFFTLLLLLFFLVLILIFFFLLLKAPQRMVSWGGKLGQTTSSSITSSSSSSSSLSKNDIERAMSDIRQHRVMAIVR